MDLTISKEKFLNLEDYLKVRVIKMILKGQIKLEE